MARRSASAVKSFRRRLFRVRWLRRLLVPVHRFPPTPAGLLCAARLSAPARSHLYPAVELIGGYDSNPQRLNAGGPGSYFTSVNPELAVRSNWARHALNAEMRGSYIWYSRTWEDIVTGTAQTDCDCDDAPERWRRRVCRVRWTAPAWNRVSIGRLDTYELSHADAEARFSLGTDNPGSPNVMAGLVKIADLHRARRLARLHAELQPARCHGRKAAPTASSIRTSHLTDGTTSSND